MLLPYTSSKRGNDSSVSRVYWSVPVLVGLVLFITILQLLSSLRNKSVSVILLCALIITWIAVGFSLTSVTEIVNAFSSFIGGLPLSVLLMTRENLRSLIETRMITHTLWVKSKSAGSIIEHRLSPFLNQFHSGNSLKGARGFPAKITAGACVVPAKSGALASVKFKTL